MLEARSLKKFTAPEETNFLTLICSDARQKIWKAEPDFASSKLMELKLKKNKNQGKKKAPHLSAFNPNQYHYNQTSSNNYGYIIQLMLT